MCVVERCNNAYIALEVDMMLGSRKNIKPRSNSVGIGKTWKYEEVGEGM